MMLINKELYGKSEFAIKDNELFKNNFTLGLDEKLKGDGKFTINTIQIQTNPNTAARIVTATITHCSWVNKHTCVGCSGSCDLYSAAGCPTGLCKDEEVWHCSDVAYTYFEEPADDWGTYGGGDESGGVCVGCPPPTPDPCQDPNLPARTKEFKPCDTNNTGITLIPTLTALTSLTVWDKFGDDEKNYVNQHQAIKADLDNLMWTEANFSNTSISASQIIINNLAASNNTINVVQNQLFFDTYIKYYLPEYLQNMSATTFWNKFNSYYNTYASSGLSQLELNWTAFYYALLTIEDTNAEQMTAAQVANDEMLSNIILPNITLPRPTFSLLWANAYDAKKTWTEIANDIGNEVKTELTTGSHNTCATRVSRALNYGGSPIPYLSNTFKGSDTKNYIMQALQMLTYLKKWLKTDAANTVHLTSTPTQPITAKMITDAIKGKKGIYVIIPNDSSPTDYSTNPPSGGWGASGHVDLVDENGNFKNHGYLGCEPGGVKEVYLFILN